MAREPFFFVSVNVVLKYEKVSEYYIILYSANLYKSFLSAHKAHCVVQVGLAGRL